MTDKFAKVVSDLDSPAKSAFPITPANTDLAFSTRFVYVGGAGNVVVNMADGTSNNVTFTSVPAGTTLRIRVNQVLSTTTATNILGLY